MRPGVGSNNVAMPLTSLEYRGKLKASGIEVIDMVGGFWKPAVGL